MSYSANKKGVKFFETQCIYILSMITLLTVTDVNFKRIKTFYAFLFFNKICAFYSVTYSIFYKIR